MFSQEKADRVINFIQHLKHTKGQFWGENFTLLPWQKEIISKLFGTVREENPEIRQYRTGYVEIPKKNGKQLNLNTPIPTPEGWKTMGELRVGDRVFDETGKPCNVVALSEIDDTETCYRITFRDGDIIEAGERHLWDVERIIGKRRHEQMTTGEIYEATVKHRRTYAGTPDELRSVIRIPVTAPLECEEAELPIDPYIYGYWLGNGHSTKTELTVRTCDVEDVRRNCPYEITSEWYQTGGGSKIFRVPALKPILLNSFRDKHISDVYLRASEAQRWALLQGLMDSDGSISDRKAQSVYVSTIKRLTEGVSELLWSLGIKNAMTEEPSTRYGKPTGETLYTIRFTTFDDQPTSRLPRKYERKRARGKATRSCFHYIRDIEPLPYPVKMRCIEVDSPSHEYLAGRSMVPTHNSELGAAIALYMLCADGEQRAEVYGCAADTNQARIIFDVACDMVRQSPVLSKKIKIIPSTKRMVYAPTGSVYQVLSADVKSKHGLNVSAVIFDELHTQPNRDLYDVMTDGAGDARRQPLWFFMTTAGNDRNSIGYEVHQKAVDIIEGRKHDPRFMAVVYGLPMDADWKDEKNWYKANPSLGYTIDIEAVRDQFRNALESPAKENTFRQLRLNQWVAQSIRWMPMDKWDACQRDFDLEDMEGRECYAGLDLSSTSDLTALVLVFPPEVEDAPYKVYPFFWMPEDNIPKRVHQDHVMYDVWAAQNLMQTTEGNVLYYAKIVQDIVDLGMRFNIREIAYDRWGSPMMMQALQDEGFTVVPFGQGYRDMSPATKEFERLVLTKGIAHNGHPVLRWNIDNVFIKQDPAGNIKMDKERSTEKIDGAVAMVMGLDRAMRANESSAYDDHDLLVF